MAANEQVRIDLTAKDDASKTIDKVADKVEDLERADAEVTVKADTDQAEKGLEQVTDDAKALSQADAVVVAKARVDDARAELKALQAEMATTRQEAEDTSRRLDDVTGGGGAGIRGNAIADLTGPLGDASGAAGDFAGVVDGLDDALGEVFTRLGASEQFVGKLSSAMGVLGVGVAAGAAVWGLWKQRQQQAEDQAKANLEAQRKLNDAIREGDALAAAVEFKSLYADAYDAAHAAGVATEEWVGFVKGATDALPSLDANMRTHLAALAEQETGFGNNTLAVERQRAQYEEWRATLQAARGDYANTNADLAATDDELGDIGATLTGKTNPALDTAADRTRDLSEAAKILDDRLGDLRAGLNMESALQNMRDRFGEAFTKVQEGTALTDADILGLKESILTVAETAKTNPAVVESQLKGVTPDNLLQVYGSVENYYARNPVPVATRLTPPMASGPGSSGTRPGPTSVPVPVEPSIVNVTMSLPSGWRGDPVAAAHQTARRAGTHYRAVGRRR